MRCIKLFFLFFILIKNVGTSPAQTSTIIQFLFTYDLQKLIVNDTANNLDANSHLCISDLKFYISKIKFSKNNKIIWEEKNSNHLIDASNPKSQKIEFKKYINADELIFHLGIDSVTNVSGALSGDLDPTKGMYWTWQSGYINFKLEGKSALCKTRNNIFQFHLGGYTYPNYCLEKINFPITNSSRINILLDLKKIIEQLELNKQAQIMSPSKEAVILSKKIANSLKIIN